MPPFGPEALENLRPSAVEAKLLSDIQEKSKQVRDKIKAIRPTTRELGTWVSPKVVYTCSELAEGQVMSTWIEERRTVHTPEARWSTTYELYCQIVVKNGEGVTPLGEQVLVYSLQSSSHSWPKESDLKHMSLEGKLKYFEAVHDTLDVLAESSTTAQ